MTTHELESFFAIGNKSVFLDASRRDMPATENSRQLLAKTNNPTLRQLFCQQTLYFSDRLVRIAGHL
jgi:hypothetical protein